LFLESLSRESDVEESNNKSSFKQKVIDNRGKEVPMDYFLYSCLETERTSQSVRGEDEVYGWPVLAAYLSNPAADSEFASMPLAGLLTRMAAWYRDTYPALANIRVIDYESLLEIVEPLVDFNRDVSLLYKARTGEDLPDFEGSVGNNKYWDDIIATVAEYFRNNGHMYVRYIQWSHAAVEAENFNTGDRPPVGRFAPGFSRPAPSGGSRGGREGNDRRPERGPPRGGSDRNAGGGRDRGPGGPGGNSRGPSNGNMRNPPRGDRPQGDRPPRGDRGPRQEGRGGGDRKHRDDVDSKLHDEAMAEVDRAIESLRNDESMDEVLLKPQNSFYRRIQHQKIVDMGYHSFSVGEGPDRSVRVARRPN
jgi:hypothetical protein